MSQGRFQIRVLSSSAPDRNKAQEVVAGAFVTLHYSIYCKEGKDYAPLPFQKTKTHHNTLPTTYQLGKGILPPGIDEGIIGLKVGDTAEIVCPPEYRFRGLTMDGLYEAEPVMESKKKKKKKEIETVKRWTLDDETDVKFVVEITDASDGCKVTWDGKEILLN